MMLTLATAFAVAEEGSERVDGLMVNVLHWEGIEE